MSCDGSNRVLLGSWARSTQDIHPVHAQGLLQMQGVCKCCIPISTSTRCYCNIRSPDRFRPCQRVLASPFPCAHPCGIWGILPVFLPIFFPLAAQRRRKCLSARSGSLAGTPLCGGTCVRESFDSTHLCFAQRHWCDITMGTSTHRKTPPRLRSAHPPCTFGDETQAPLRSYSDLLVG